MKIEIRDGVMSIGDLKELDGTNSLCRQVRAQMPAMLRAIEVDLSRTEFLNSMGLGELLALQKMAWKQNQALAVRVLNPPAPLQQLFELTGLHQVFEIRTREHCPS